MADYAIHDTTLIAQANILRKKFGTNDRQDPADYAYKMNLMGLLEEKTQASASVCAFSDGADDVPTKSLVVTIPPTLSGTSLLNEKQTGRNLVDGYVDYSNVNKVVEPQFYKAGTYTFSCVRATNLNGIYVRKGSVIDLTAESISSKYNTLTNKFSVSEDGYYFIQLYRNTSSPTWEDEPVTNVMLEYGSTAHAYEPYQTPTTYTASLGRTIYGGQVDIVNGTGTDGCAKDSMTSTYLSGLSSSYIGYEASTNYFGGHPTIWVRNWNYQTAKTRQAGGIGCECYYFPVSMHNTDIINTQNRIYFDVNGKNISDVSGFIAFVQNLEENNESLDIVYELENKTDFTFTGQEIPTKLGYNAFWSDEGDTEVTYRGSGTITPVPVVPTLITKTITENDTYLAEDDGADGYSEVIVNVSGGGGGSCERLFYARCYDNYQVEIPTISSLVQGTNYSSYVSYDTTTKKFTALQDFTAVIIGWVYTYQTYEASYSQGAFVVNNKRLATYTATGKTQGSTGGAYMVYNFKQGDEFYPYTPSTDGYPRQNCKVYLVSDLDDDIYTFADEEA